MEKEIKIPVDKIREEAGNCEAVREALKRLAPEAFEPEKPEMVLEGRLFINGRETISPRHYGDYADIAFFVDTTFHNFELKKDNKGVLCLIHARK